MNHLEAFLSDDGKRGREWRDADGLYFSRLADRLVASHSGVPGTWSTSAVQVAAMEGECRWADEPKTLTPQEALRALADGKCVKGSRFIYKLVDKEICAFKPWPYTDWFPTTYFYRECHVVPDPSQPAEPQTEYPLTFEEAIGEAMSGSVVTWRHGHIKGAVFRYVAGGFEASFASKPYSFHCIEWEPTAEEKAARWRIVEGK